MSALFWLILAATLGAVAVIGGVMHGKRPHKLLPGISTACAILCLIALAISAEAYGA